MNGRGILERVPRASARRPRPGTPAGPREEGERRPRPRARAAARSAAGRLVRSPFRRVLAYAAIAGPGIVAANAGNDAGGIATYSSAGSQFVYGTLFFMVLVTIALVLVQVMAVKLGAYTGKGLGALIREQFSLRMTGIAVLSVLVANTGLVVSEFAGIGAAFQLMGVSRYVVVPISAVIIWALVLFGSYRYAERVFLVLSLAFFAYPIAAVLARPKWGAVASNLVVPHFQFTTSYILLGVALIGTTVSPYMQLYAASGVVDRGAGADDYRAVRADAASGAIFACIISIMIIIATGATIGGKGALNSAAEAAEALRPVAGSGAEMLFAIGLLGASALAGAVVPLSSSYAISEAVGVERSVSRRFTEAPLFLGLFTFQVVLGAAVSLMPVNLISLLIVTQVIEGIITPVLLTFILIMSNRRSLLGNAANGPVLKVAATVSVAAISVMSLFLLGQTVFSWLSF